MSDRFNALAGMSCQPADGAMYLFPRIDIPPKAVEEAKKQGKEADVMYALELLGESATPAPCLFLPPQCPRSPLPFRFDNGKYGLLLTLLDATGICAVAGSGFGQEPGTYHLRVTALCPGVENYVGKIEKFHKEFMDKWA